MVIKPDKDIHELDREKIVEELIRPKRIKLLGQVLKGQGHNLNGQLHCIIGNTKRIRKKLAHHHDLVLKLIEPYLNDILEGCQQIQDTVHLQNKLTQDTNEESTQDYKLVEIIDKIISLLRSNYKRQGIHIKRNEVLDLVTIRGDYNQLLELFFDILNGPLLKSNSDNLESSLELTIGLKKEGSQTSLTISGNEYLIQSILNLDSYDVLERIRLEGLLNKFQINFMREKEKLILIWSSN